MDGEWRFTRAEQQQIAKVRIANLAARQSGVVARRQLMHLDVSSGSIAWWLRAGYLIRLLPGVYAVGHVPRSFDAELTAALLLAGPGAMLSHHTAAWWRGLLKHRPQTVEISTPRRVESLPGISVHGRRDLVRLWHHGLPVTSVAQTLIDLAATRAPHDLLRRALAEAEYRDWLDLDTLRPHLHRGVVGSAALRAAIVAHEPRLAMTRSELEDRFIALCTRAGLPPPECNRWIEGLLVDALWRKERVVVEVDGRDGHRTWAQTVRDRRRDLILRRAAYTVLRYVSDQLRDDVAAVEGDIAAALRKAA